MKTLLSCCIILLVVLVGVQASAQQTLVLFDDFKETFLDPSLWVGIESRQDPGIQMLESVRQIQGGKLRLLNRVYTNNTASDTGSFYGATRLLFKDGVGITAIKASVQVKNLAVNGCSSNTAPSQVRARLGGNFFNTGTPTPGSNLNDVQATMYLRRASDSTDDPSVLEVAGLVLRCDDANCNTFTSLGSLDRNTLGTVKKGKAVDMLIEWDQATHRFIFQQGKGKKLLEGSVYYQDSPNWNPSWTDTQPPGNTYGGYKRLEVHNYVPNCTTQPPPFAFMEAFFDNVYVNP